MFGRPWNRYRRAARSGAGVGFCWMLFAALPVAHAAEWRLSDQEGKIEVEGTLNGKPHIVELPGMTGSARFDRENLAESDIAVSIPLLDLRDDLDAAVKTLKSPAWFNIGDFAQARFFSTSVVQNDDGTYRADGRLTIKGIAKPASLTFTFDAYGPDPDKAGQQKAVVIGQTTLNRLDFNLGTDWNASLPSYKIGNQVTVRFQITAIACDCTIQNKQD